MRHLQLLSGLAGLSIGLLACTGSHLMLDDSVPPGLRDEATRDSTGSGGAGAPDMQAGATGGSVSEQPPPPPDDWHDPPSASGAAGAAVPVAGAAGSSVPPSFGGSGGSPFDPENPHASDVLNPQRCATEEPFVLAIDPGGASGEVRGWLESAPSVSFDGSDLPRFGTQSDPGTEPEGDLTLWWSISSLDGDERSLWFYAANAATQVAYVPWATSPADIGDARMYMYASWSVGPVKVGEFAVFHHVPSDRYIAVQALDLYGTEDSDRRDTCAAVDARWYVAPRGTGDFSIFSQQQFGLQ